jgi:hypothetical protein
MYRSLQYQGSSADRFRKGSYARAAVARDRAVRRFDSGSSASGHAASASLAIASNSLVLEPAEACTHMPFATAIK